MGEIVRKTFECLEGIIDKKTYEIVDVEFVKEGPMRFLRVYIDREGGVTVNDCEFVSRSLDKILDEKDFIKYSYILEVSSPGGRRRNEKLFNTASEQGGQHAEQ